LWNWRASRASTRPDWKTKKIMIARLIEFISGIIVATISLMGYSGIVMLMAIESACIPLPSEIIMPFSGYLVSTGELNLWLVALAGAIGCVLG